MHANRRHQPKEKTHARTYTLGLKTEQTGPSGVCSTSSPVRRTPAGAPNSLHRKVWLDWRIEKTGWQQHPDTYNFHLTELHKTCVPCAFVWHIAHCFHIVISLLASTDGNCALPRHNNTKLTIHESCRTKHRTFIHVSSIKYHLGDSIRCMRNTCSSPLIIHVCDQILNIWRCFFSH